MNIMKILKTWWKKYKYHQALNRVEFLERERKWIDPFFMGKTKYEIRFSEWRRDMKLAEEALEKFSHL